MSENQPVQDRAAMYAELLLSLGKVLHPVEELLKQQREPASAEYTIAAEKFWNDVCKWFQILEKYVTIDGVKISPFMHSVSGHLKGIRNEILNPSSSMGRSVNRRDELRIQYSDYRRSALKALQSIPVNWAPSLSSPGTPFAAYLKIKDAIGTAKTRMHYIDRYLEQEFCVLYLRHLNRDVEVRILTTAKGVNAISAVSEKVAKEFSNYQLLECTAADIHDRNLRVDDQVFHLGPSAKDAGVHPANFTLGDSTENGHKELDDLLAKGKIIHQS